MSNKYYERTKNSEAKFRQLIRYFAMDFTTTDTAELTGLSRRPVNTLFRRLRRKIVRWYEHQDLLAGTIEVDESYFGPRRIPGKRDTSGKTIVFGIFKHQGKVYTEIIPDGRKKTLQRVIRGKVIPGSVIHIGGEALTGWLTCDMISIIGSGTTKMNLLIERVTLMALSRFGVWPNAG